MEQGTVQENGDILLQDALWNFDWHTDSIDANGLTEGHRREPAWIGPPTDVQALAEPDPKRISWENFLLRLGEDARVSRSVMTVADFVQKVFVPEHVATKGLSGRTHYQAILKHVLRPEEVDRVFRVNTENSKTRLKALPDWPYLGSLRLRDVRPDHVQRLVFAALARGYSTQTIKHIRSVVSAVFSHAKKTQYCTGDNPASEVTLPESTRKEAHTLTLAQVREVIGVLHYPEKEITLIAVLTGMNVTEICGLQWKRVNLTEARSNMVDGEPIPPRTIFVRKQWHRGGLDCLGRKSRCRNLRIPDPLLPVLLGLRQRATLTGPEDFVLVSRAGTPINEHGITPRRLKPIGKDLQMPWLSWHAFYRTHKALAHELGTQFLGERVASGR